MPEAPEHTQEMRLDLYDRALKILDVGGSKTRMDVLLQQVPEVPSRDRLAAVVARMKTERNMVANGEKGGAGEGRGDKEKGAGGKGA